MRTDQQIKGFRPWYTEQGGHKPGKLREFEKLLKSQGKLKEIFYFAEKPGKLRENVRYVT